MYCFDDLKIWNLAPRVPSVVGAQRIFNIVGGVDNANEADRLVYSLNGGPEKPVFLKRSDTDSERLERIGDFNIDTIETADLMPANRLRFRLIRRNLVEKRYPVDFGIRKYPAGVPEFKLKLAGVTYAQEVGQIVDGRWIVTRDEQEGACLESPDEAGYDRIILFGHSDWSTGYELYARVRVTRWTGRRDMGLGVAFKWNPHLGGGGTSLPSRWSTGIGQYYFPKNLPRPGLSIAMGVNVHYDGKGKYVGEQVLKQGMLSPWRWAIGALRSHVLRMENPFPQIVPQRAYSLRMRVSSSKYALTVWPARDREPSPQVVARKPVEKLAGGSVGIVAHRCGLRVYEFTVNPIS
ncbi:MAG: hypothetical protein JRK53_20130 [Deltaproteobacteria bacterium]|nr:hypothetical protein [Deltaproteobacteria bacterium]